MTRGATDLSRAALQTSVRRLLAALGGTDAASTVTRVVRSKLHSYGDATVPDRQMPIDIVLDLETCLGQPIVTQELARLTGHLVIPTLFGEGDAARALGDVAGDSAKTLTDGLRALSDNLPPEELDLVLADLAQLHAAVTTAIGVLRGKAAAAAGRAAWAPLRDVGAP